MLTLWAVALAVVAAAGLVHWALRSPGDLTYRIARESVQAVAPTGRVVWEHPTRLLVPRVDKLSTGEVVFAEAGKGAGGTLWCLSPRGRVLWCQEGRMWVVGVDGAGNILVHGGTPGEGQFSRLYSREGGLLWQQLGRNVVLPRNEAGAYVPPEN